MTPLLEAPSAIMWLLATGGLFSVVCAIGDYDWFMNNRKAWLVVKVFGRNGARIFYVLLGLALMVGGVGMAMGWFPQSSAG